MVASFKDPFDLKTYQLRCDGMSTAELQKEWNKYTRQIAGASASTVSCVAKAPFTYGTSLIELLSSAPKIHEARKKRAIINHGLEANGVNQYVIRISPSSMLRPENNVPSCLLLLSQVLL
jgi:hypothetical protein